MTGKLIIKPVPEAELVEIAQKWGVEAGVNPDVIAHLSQVRDTGTIEHMTAVIFNHVYYTLRELTLRGYLEPDEGGKVELLRLVRAAHKKDHEESGKDAERAHWRKVRKNIREVFAIAYLDIIFPQPHNWNSLWRQVVLASGYEGFPIHDVTMSIISKGLGIMDMEGNLVTA